MMTTVPVLLFTLLSLISPATSTPATRSTSDAWLWQRQVTDPVAVVDAFARFSSGRLHVMAADDAFVVDDPRLARALAAAHVPVVLTLRFTTLPPSTAIIVATLQRWQAAGVDVVAVEIDHDCATSKLTSYATWLRALKTTLKTTPLAITALPAWLDHADHRAVFAAVDDVTVQVHAIKAPALFDVDAALRVVTARPDLRIALPTYAVTLKGGIPIFASPHDVSVVRAAAPRVAWFRMPIEGDTAAWTWTTLSAVDTGLVADGALTVRFVADDDGAFDVVVDNAGAVDVALTDVVVKDAVVADAIAGFAVERIAVGWRWTSTTARFLAPGMSIVVGWARPSKGAAPHANVGTRQ